MWMINALIAIYAVRRRPRILRATMTAVIPMSYKQPESPDEEALCKEAMEGCPVEAIGSDGG